MSERVPHRHLALPMWAAILVFLYTLSGLTSLAYEVLWARMLAVQFGVSIFGVVVSVTALMAGLGFGSLLGARYCRWVRNPLLIFALIEAAVALYALASPVLLQAFDTLLTKLAPQVGLLVWYLIQGVSALVLLLIPAVAMGAAFAFMLKALAPSQTSLSKIYGLNACGGGVGAVLPLWLLPAVGWSRAMQIIAGIGLAVGLAAFLMTRFTNTAQQLTEIPAQAQRPGFLTLFTYAGVGASALILEIAWTRLFGMVLLRTEYVLAVILAIFVVGIGLGSLLVNRVDRIKYISWPWFSLLPLTASAFALLSLWWLPTVSAWAEQANFNSLFGAVAAQALILTAITMPVTLIFGAWLPLLSARAGTAGQTGAWLYGANSLGAALGAILAGTLLLPWLGAAGTVCMAALLLFVCGALFSHSRWHIILLGLTGLGLLAWPVRELPPVARLLPVAQAGSKDIYQHEDAITITQVIERPDGQRILLTDLQRMDATSDQAAVAVQENQARLPLLLHPAPRSVLFLGLGTGISVAGSQPFPGLSRTAVELSQGAITAARIQFAPVNKNIMQQTKIMRDDARRFLRADTASYDVIIGDLFHPDLAGHSALLSVQQFARARARLADGGLFVQWLALNQFDAESLDIVLRSFQRAFPEAVLFVDGFRLALVGPKDKLLGAPAMLVNLQRLSPQTQQQATGGEGAWTWLGRYWGKLAPSTGPVQDEWAPRIEFRLPRARYAGELNLALLLEKLLQSRPAF
ncbi:MAG: spermine synthase, partial [Gammaproteobacteria bacterium]